MLKGLLKEKQKNSKESHDLESKKIRCRNMEDGFVPED